MTGFGCQFNCRHHVTVGRDYDSYIAIVLVCVGYDLRSYAHICFFFFMCTNQSVTMEASNLFPQVLSENQFEFRILVICLKKGTLSQTFVNIVDTG